MFTSKVLRLFRDTFGPWVTATPPRLKRNPTFVPSLERLEDRWCPATVNLYFDPTNGNNASTPANWDVGSLNGMHNATAAPGKTAGETDNIYFDGTVGRGGNQSCTWDYTPTNPLGTVFFQNAYTQTLSFLDKQGFQISGGSGVKTESSVTLAPNGISGANAVAGITLTNNGAFSIDSSSLLKLTGYTKGNAIFFAGDNKAPGQALYNGGQVVYTGQGKGNTDYIKIPVENASAATFTVNGGGGAAQGATLQVSGTTGTTSNVSFYQDGANAQTSLSGGGTLWCVNDYKMTTGVLQTTDAQDTLKVGTSGNNAVDGTVTLTGGSVKIFPNAGSFGKLYIVGTTGANNPTLNLGSVTIDFNIDMTPNSDLCSQLIVGNGSTGGTVNFGNNGGTTTVQTNFQGNATLKHAWQIISFGSRTGDVTQTPVTYTKKWNPNNLELDYN